MSYYVRDRHYILLCGEWRRVPRIVQMLWERYAARVFGRSATSTRFGVNGWTGNFQ